MVDWDMVSVRYDASEGDVMEGDLGGRMTEVYGSSPEVGPGPLVLERGSPAENKSLDARESGGQSPDDPERISSSTDGGYKR